MIEDILKDLDRYGGRKMIVNEYEYTSNELQSYDPKTKKWTVKSSSSTGPEVENDENPRNVKSSQIKTSNGNLKFESSSTRRTTSTPLSMLHEIRNIPRPESSLSQAVSVNMGSNKSTTTTPTPTRISPIRDRSMSPSKRSKSEKNVSIGGTIEYSDRESSSPEYSEYFKSGDSSFAKSSDDLIRGSWSNGIDKGYATDRKSRSSVVSPSLSKSRSPSRSSSGSPTRSPTPGQWALANRERTHEIKRTPTPGLSSLDYATGMKRSISTPSVEPISETETMTLPKSNRRRVLSPVPGGPVPEYMSKLRHIKVATVPGPVIPPKFGTITRGGRWPNEAQGPRDIGPPCELCKKPITEIRFIVQEDLPYHVEHFTCNYCSKMLRPMDFLMSPDNKKPYCVNCYKRQFP